MVVGVQNPLYLNQREYDNQLHQILDIYRRCMIISPNRDIKFFFFFSRNSKLHYIKTNAWLMEKTLHIVWRFIPNWRQNKILSQSRNFVGNNICFTIIKTGSKSSSTVIDNSSTLRIGFLMRSYGIDDKFTIWLGLHKIGLSRQAIAKSSPKKDLNLWWNPKVPQNFSSPMQINTILDGQLLKFFLRK